MSEILCLAGIWISYLLADELIGRDSHVLANLLGPLAMTACLAHGAWRMVRLDGRNLWTALFWFRLSTSAYFGIGTYVIFILNNFTRLYLESFNQFFDEDIFKMNLVVSLSVVLVLTTARVVILAAWWPRRAAQQEDAGGAGMRMLPIVGTLFICLGLTVSFTIKYPQEFGWTTGEWPGTIMGLSRLTMVGIFMLTLWSFERARWFLPVITTIAAVEIGVQSLLFAKTGILMTLVMYLLAYLWRRVTLVRAVACAALVVGTYGSLDGVVSFGRHVLDSTGETQAGLTRRFAIMESYLAYGSKGTLENEERQGALLRISYVNAATFIIRQYDMGNPGDWPRLLPAVFVPRFMWAEKPIITDVGVDIYELGTGRRTSSTGAGVFAEAYWAKGWTGILVYMPVYGAILAALTMLSARLLQQQRWLFFPVVLLGMMIGYRTDGHYISDVAGATVILVGMLGVLSVVDLAINLLAPRRRARVSQRLPEPGGWRT